MSSTSRTTTTPPISTEPRAPRIRVRATERLTAYQSLKSDTIQTIIGDHLHAGAGDWVLLRENHVLTVLPDHLFRQRYEIDEEGTLILSGADRTTLEQTLGFGQTRDPAMLVNGVKRLASLKIGNVEVNFSVAQWQEIARRADKTRLSVQDWMQRAVDRFFQDMWTNA